MHADTRTLAESLTPHAGAPALEPSARRGITLILALGTFVVGTDAFVMSGILPQLARAFHVSLGAAGQIVTVFALGYAVLAPLLAAATTRWSRRAVLLSALAVFGIGNILTARAPTLWFALVARVVAAAGAALFTPNASATATEIVRPERRARAIATVTMGLTLSVVLGAPLGTLIGSRLEWRATMWFVSILAALAAIPLALRLPRVSSTGGAPDLRHRLLPLRDRRVLAVLGTTVLLFTGVFLPYTYLSAVFAPAISAGTGAAIGNRLALLMLAYGVCGTFGNLLAGRLADRYGARGTIAVAAMTLVVLFGMIPLLRDHFGAALLSAGLFGWAAWSITTPQQQRIVSLAPGAAPLVLALNASGIYLGVSLSGLIGAAGLEVFHMMGLSAAELTWLAAAFVAAGLGASELAARRSASP